jgi:hypothetical protein
MCLGKEVASSSAAVVRVSAADRFSENYDHREFWCELDR